MERDELTTRMSSKGQVVIPEEIRHRLGLTAGPQFVVIGSDGVVSLKTLTPPTMSDFDEFVGQARKAGLKRSVSPPA
jgi:AbrB family looped-hinge helix DNA binding protein